MLRYIPIWCLRHSRSCSTYSHLSLIRAGCTNSMTLSKYSQSPVAGYQAEVGLVNLALHKSRKTLSTQATGSFANFVGQQVQFGLSTRQRSLSLGLSIPIREKQPRMKWNFSGVPSRIGSTVAGLCLSFSVSAAAHAEAPMEKNSDCNERTASSTSSTHGKTVYTDYSVHGIPGDGRCLFRSIAYGACIRSGKSVPSEELQRQLADELRAMVADEFVNRRAESEWFVEGDFDAYVAHMRKPHVWGGEPELFMASHVLQMPITVYMHDQDAGGLIAIAEYGQEYGKDDPIQVLFHGFGHYDALKIPGRKGAKSRL